jgi:hypothetical protein
MLALVVHVCIDIIFIVIVVIVIVNFYLNTSAGSCSSLQG